MRPFLFIFVLCCLGVAAEKPCTSILKIVDEIETYEFLLSNSQSPELKDAIRAKLRHLYQKLDEHVEGPKLRRTDVGQERRGE